MRFIKIFSRFDILKDKTEPSRTVLKADKVKRCDRFPGTCMHAFATGSSGRSGPYDKKRKKVLDCKSLKDCGNLVDDIGPDPSFFDESGNPISGNTGLQG